MFFFFFAIRTSFVYRFAFHQVARVSLNICVYVCSTLFQITTDWSVMKVHDDAHVHKLQPVCSTSACIPVYVSLPRWWGEIKKKCYSSFSGENCVWGALLLGKIWGNRVHFGVTSHHPSKSVTLCVSVAFFSFFLILLFQYDVVWICMDFIWINVLHATDWTRQNEPIPGKYFPHYNV